jgi:hypothetical protein
VDIITQICYFNAPTPTYQINDQDVYPFQSIQLLTDDLSTIRVEGHEQIEVNFPELIDAFQKSISDREAPFLIRFRSDDKLQLWGHHEYHVELDNDARDTNGMSIYVSPKVAFLPAFRLGRGFSGQLSLSTFLWEHYDHGPLKTTANLITELCSRFSYVH